MSAKKSKDVNWEPDVKKGLDKAKTIKEQNEKLRKDWDHTKQEGFNKT